MAKYLDGSGLAQLWTKTKNSFEGISEAKVNQEFIYRPTNVSWNARSEVLKKIKGRSLVWNQGIGNGDFSNGTTDWTIMNGTATVEGGGVLTFTPSSDNTVRLVYPSIHPAGISGHKYYYAATISGNTGFCFCCLINNVWHFALYNSGPTKRVSAIVSPSGNYGISIQYRLLSTSDGTNASISNVIGVDLTLMFGAGHEPSTTAEFEAMFPKPYYPYNTGEIIDNTTEAYETVGFNQCRVEPRYYNTFPSYLDKNIASHLLPGTYYYSHGVQGATSWRHQYRVFDINGNLISDPEAFYEPSNTYYNSGNEAFVDGANNTNINGTLVVNRECYIYIQISNGNTTESTKFTNYCLNLSDTNKNGIYEPYWNHKVNLDLGTIRVKSHNIWDEEWEISYGKVASKNYIPVFPNTAYYCNAGPNGTWGEGLTWYDAEKQLIKTDFGYSGVYTSPSNAAYLKFMCLSAYGTTYNNDICINLSSSFDGNYEPHRILTKSGLKSAGSVYDEVRDGKYIKRVGSVDLGDLYYVFTEPDRFNIAYRLTDAADGLNLICPDYIAIEVNSTADKTMWIANSGYLYIRNSAYSDAATFQAAMAGVMLYYELATPIEYDLAEPIPSILKCDMGGTERAISNHLSAPFVADIQYGANTGDIVLDGDQRYMSASPSNITISSEENAKLVLDNTTKNQTIDFQQVGETYGKLGTSGDNDLKWNSSTILRADNYTTYTISKDGTGASGTWGISISGNATSASSVPTLSNSEIDAIIV